MGKLAERARVARRVRILFEMQDIIAQLANDDQWDAWLAYGLPDGITIEDAIDMYMYIPDDLNETFEFAKEMISQLRW